MATGYQFQETMLKAKAGELRLAWTVCGLHSEARQAGQRHLTERSIDRPSPADSREF